MKHVMRLFAVVAMATVLLCQAWAQNATGRSNSGSIIPPAKLKAPTESLAPTMPLRSDLEFSEPSGNGLLDPRERGRLRVILTNISRAPVRGISVKIVAIDNSARIAFNELITVGDIPTEAVRYAFFYFTAGQKIDAPSAKFRVQVIDTGGSEIADAKELTIATREGH